MSNLCIPSTGDWRRWAVAFTVAMLAACGGSDDDNEADRADDPQPTANAQMKAVLDELGALGAKPINTLTVAQARSQPTPADAVRSLLVKQGRSTAPEPVGSVEDRVIASAAGPIPIRIYKPAAPAAGPRPSLLYIHGGGWVIATLDTYDASARALANAAGAIVVSTDYRRAPEFAFPAAHEDTYAAWKWLLANAVSLGGSARQIAVVGESAGGNMAASIARRARDDSIQAPVHQGLVYPVVSAELNRPSHQQNRDALPLNTASLIWFFDRYLPSAAQRSDPRFNLLGVASLAGLAPTTLISADIDPLRSEGRLYAESLSAAGVAVDWAKYEGVTHEFFGMGAVLDAARAAVQRVADGLKASYARVGP